MKNILARICAWIRRSTWSGHGSPIFTIPSTCTSTPRAFAAAVTIGQRIFDGDKNALEGYFNFLKGGSSMKPTELLKLCGLDMEGPGVVNAALDVFESLLGSLE